MSALLAPLIEPAPAERKRRPFLVADLLCGAGGSSSGAKRAIEAAGRTMDLVAVNHWDVAIRTHTRNHPDARHYVEDIAACRPHLLVPEGRLDLLMASPTCTHHSRARGGKPTSDQQRADPWHVVTWLTELRVKRLLIENVPEFLDWGPVDTRTGKPVRSRKGVYFEAWVAAITALGFRPEWRVLNAADFGDATTRKRVFLLARSDGVPVRWPAASHSRAGSADLFGHGVKPWRPAREIIDWQLAGQSIFRRKRPLAPATLRRIYAGIVRFRWPEPYLVVLRQHMAARAIDLPLPAITAGGNHIGIATPILLRANQSKGRSGRDLHSGEAPLPTVTCSDSLALAYPLLLPQASDQAPTRDVGDPIPTVTTVARVGLIEPFTISTRQHTGGPAPRRSAEPLPTLTATDSRIGIVEPVVLSQASGGAPRSVDEPAPTITTGGNGGAHALVAPYYGAGSGLTCKPVTHPLDTVTPKNRFGLVMPVTHTDASNRCHDIETPLPTITCAQRGELAFIAASFGERDGQAPRVHDLEAPVPTICAQGRVNVVEPMLVNLKGRSDVSSVDRPAPTVTAHARHLALAEGGLEYDILFRMLEPHELARAMGFDDGDQRYLFSGNKTEITRQIGNAVPVNTAAALVGAIVAE